MEDGGERWSKPYVATLSLHSLFELRSCIINGSVLLDVSASSVEDIAGTEGTSFPGDPAPKTPAFQLFPPGGFLGFEWGLGVQRCGLRWEEGFGLEGGWGAFCG